MTLDLARLLLGGLFGTLAASTAGERTGSPLEGIVIFAVGLIVGLVSVYFMDHLVRTRMRSDYDAWVASGKPDRRSGPQRRGDDRRAIGQD